MKLKSKFERFKKKYNATNDMKIHDMLRMSAKSDEHQMI